MFSKLLLPPVQTAMYSIAPDDPNGTFQLLLVIRKGESLRIKE